MEKTRGVGAIFAERNPRYLLIGQTASFFGDSVANIALSILILDLTHRASAMGWFGAARVIPLLVFVLFGGAVVDRLPRRLLLIVSDVGRAAVLTVVMVLLMIHRLTYSELIVLAVLFGTADAVFTPAISAIVPEITPSHLLVSYNSARSAAITLSFSVVGPLVGGFIAALSTPLSLGIDIATFIISAGCAIALPRLAKPEPSPNSMLSDIAAGLKFVWRAPWISRTLGAALITNAFVYSPLYIAVFYSLRHVFHESKSMIGLILAASSLTQAFVTIAMSYRPTPRHRVRTMWLYWLVGTLSGLFMVVANNPWLLIIFPLIAGPAGSLGQIIWESLLQEEVPTELLGRVSSVDWFVSLGFQPVGLALAGTLFDRFGIHTYYLVTVAVSVPLIIAVMLSPRSNEVDAGR